MAITLTPGQIVGSGDWDALFTQHGGMPTTNQAVRRSRTEAEMKAAALAGDDDPAAQQRPIYRYVLADGSYVDARTSPDGLGWEVIEYKPSQQFQQQQPTRSEAAGQKPTVGRVEGTPTGRKNPDGTDEYDNTKPIWVERDPVTRQQVGPAKPLTKEQRDQWEREKNGGKTDAELRAEQTDRVGKPTGNTRQRSENGTTVKETEYLLPDGSTVWRSQTETTTPDRVGKPTGNARSRVENGQTIKEAEYVLPDGTKEWRSQTAPAEGTTVDLAGAPQLDLSTPERARATYNELFLFVDRLVREGKLTAEKGKAYLAGPHSAVANKLDEAKEQREIAREERQTAEGLRRDQLTERSQDMTQAGNRLSFGQNAASTAIKTSGDLIKAAEGGESTIVPLMVLQAGMGQAMGGFRESPSVTLGSGLMPRVAQSAVPGAPAVADPNTVGQPNQLGLGAVPGIMTPGGVSDTTDAGGVPRVYTPASATGGPPPSGADVAAANAATSAQSREAFGALGVPPAPPTGQPTRGPYDLMPVTPNTPPATLEPIPVAPHEPPLTGPDDPRMQRLDERQSLRPNQILRSGLGVGTRTADDLERELLAEGFSPEEIRAARRRAEARAGIGVAV